MTHSAPKPYRFSYTVSMLALGCILMSIGSIAGTFAGYALLGPLMLRWPALEMVTMDIGLYLIGLPLALLLWHFVPGTALPVQRTRSFSLPMFTGFGLFAVGGGYLALQLTYAAMELLGLNQSFDVSEMAADYSPLSSLVIIALIPAVMEEFVFRGLMYKKLAPYGEKPYVLVSALLFSSFHGNLVQFFFSFFLGICFAMMVWRTGTLVYGMMLHFLINFLSGCVLTPLMDDLFINAVMGLWVMATIAVCIAFFVLKRRWLRLDKGHDLPRHPVLAALLNPGMIVWLLLTLVTVTATLLP